MIRTITTVLGISTAAFIALTAPKIAAQAPYLHLGWLVPAVALLLGGPLVIAVVARRLALPALRRTIGAYAIAFIVVVASWPLGMSIHPMPMSQSPWVLGLTTLGTVAAALAWRGWIAWAYGVANAAIVIPVRNYASGGENLEVAIQDGIFTFIFVAIFSALAIVTVSNARTLDRAAVLARQAAAESAFAESSAREQARLDALVHDQILTTLYYAGQGDPALAEALRAQAQGALLELSRLSDPEGAEGVPFAELASRLRVSADAAGASMSITGGHASIPAPAAAALSEAMAEALRNSVQHAPSSRRSVTVDGASGVTVTVRDDGPGFERSAVSPRRLGIPLSIEGRLAAAGGNGEVRSARGAGTEVVMTWPA